MKKKLLAFTVLFITIIYALPLTASAAEVTNATASVSLNAHCGKDGSDTYTLGRISIGTACTGTTLEVGDEITSWFNNIPEGIQVHINSISSNFRRYEIKVSGTPISSVEPGEYVVDVTIPANTIYIDGELYPDAITASGKPTIYVVEEYTYIDHVNVDIDYSSLVFDGVLDNLASSWFDVFSSQDVGVEVSCEGVGFHPITNTVSPSVAIVPSSGYKFSDDCSFSVNPDFIPFVYNEEPEFSNNNGEYKGPFSFFITTNVSYNYLETQVKNYFNDSPTPKYITFHSSGIPWIDDSTSKVFSLYEESTNLYSSTLELQSVTQILNIIDGFELVGWTTEAGNQEITYDIDDVITYADLLEAETNLYAIYECKDPSIIAYGACGETMLYTLDINGEMRLLGKGYMYSYTHTDGDYPPWHNYLNQIKTLFTAPGIKSITGRAFTSSTLEHVTLSEGIESISQAFFYAQHLKEIHLPSSIEVMAAQTFQGCSALTAITVDENNRCYSSIDGILYNKEQTWLETYPGGKTQESFTTPDSVYLIAPYAFNSNYHLKTLFIHDGVNRIQWDCLPLNDELTVYFDGPEWEWAHLTRESTLSDKPTIVFSNTEDYMSGACGDAATWKLTKDGVLTISGEGAMWDYANEEHQTINSVVLYSEDDSFTVYHTVPWGGMQQGFIHTLIVEEGITHIGSCAFFKIPQHYGTISTVLLPSTLKSIGNFAFDDREDLNVQSWYENTRYDTVEYAFFNGTEQEFEDVVVGFGNRSVVEELQYLSDPEDDGNDDAGEDGDDLGKEDKPSDNDSEVDDEPEVEDRPGSHQKPEVSEPEQDDDGEDSVVVTLPFTDVNETDWFYSSVQYVYHNGLMNGTDIYTFAPNATTSRAMIVTVLWRLEGQPAPNTACTFTDVAPDAYYEQAIAWAAENGIVMGYDEKTFGIDSPITREQFATILWRYAKYKGYDVSVGENTNILSYSDVFDISEYAIPAMQWACSTGLMNGIDGSLMPDSGATRAQTATLLYRFSESAK